MTRPTTTTTAADSNTPNRNLADEFEASASKPVSSVVLQCVSWFARRSHKAAVAAQQTEKAASPPGPRSELATPVPAHHADRVAARSSRRVHLCVPTPDTFLLAPDRAGSPPGKLKLEVIPCERLVGKPIERAPPSLAEVESYGVSVAQWVATLPWFQKETLATAEDIFLLCVERRLVETYFSMRLVALAALFASAKYHELVDSIKLKEVVALTEGITARDVRLAEAALLNALGFDVLAAGRLRAEEDEGEPISPAGVEDLDLVDARPVLRPTKSAPL